MQALLVNGVTKIHCVSRALLEYVCIYEQTALCSALLLCKWALSLYSAWLCQLSSLDVNYTLQ